MSRHNSKNNGPVLLFLLYLGTETVSCRLLLWMERIDMEHEKIWPTFNALPAKITPPPPSQKKNMVCAPLVKFVCDLNHNQGRI